MWAVAYLRRPICHATSALKSLHNFAYGDIKIYISVYKKTLASQGQLNFVPLLYIGDFVSQSHWPMAYLWEIYGVMAPWRDNTNTCGFLRFQISVKWADLLLPFKRPKAFSFRGLRPQTPDQRLCPWPHRIYWLYQRECFVAHFGKLTILSFVQSMLIGSCSKRSVSLFFEQKPNWVAAVCCKW